MSSAVKIFQGRFGRVALLDMDSPLVGHAHHHCHILVKAGGADSAFSVRGERAPLTDDTAVLVNAWEHHAYEHDAPPGANTLILALYIEPGWLTELQRSLAMSGHPRFFPQPCVRITAATRKIAEEFVLELWWADEVSPGRLEDLLFNLIIAVIDSYSGWRDLAGLLRSKPPVAMDNRVRQAIALMKQDVGHDLEHGRAGGAGRAVAGALLHAVPARHPGHAAGLCQCAALRGRGASSSPTAARPWARWRMCWAFRRRAIFRASSGSTWASRPATTGAWSTCSSRRRLSAIHWTGR